MSFILLKNICFELSIRKKQISTYVYFLLFFSFGLIAILAAGGSFKGVVISLYANKVFVNSPISLHIIISLAGAFGLFIIAPVFGQSIYKDYGANVHQLIFSTPAHRISLLLGRFIGAFLVLGFIFSGTALGMWMGTHLSLIQPALLGPNDLKSYLMPYLTGVWPNMFFFGSLFFLLVSKVKKMGPIYVAGTLIFMGWMLTGPLRDLDNKMATSLIDPFGFGAILNLTEYWSVHEQNTQYVTLSGYYLYNRLLWVGLGLICFLWSLFTFKPNPRVTDSSHKKEALPQVTPKEPSLIVLSSQDFSFLSRLNMLGKQVKFELSQIFNNVYFHTILLAGVLYLALVGQQVNKIWGTKTYPLTYTILDVMGGSFDIFILIILTFYAGEAIWRERDNRIHQIFDAFPTPTWVPVIAKYLSLLLVTMALLFVLMICGIITQTFKGYTHYELDLYFKHLFLIKFISFVNILALAFFLQVILKNKYIGHGAMIGYYILHTFMPAMGFEHKLYNFNAADLPLYSDMNQYGRFLEGYFAFKFYWLSFSVFMLIMVLLFWQRGVLTDWGESLKEFKRRLDKKHVFSGLFSILVALTLGIFIFYNTNEWNSYITLKEKEALQYQYEKKYKKYEWQASPQITSVKAHVDIFPYQARIKTKVYYRMKNKSEKPINEILLNVRSTWNPTLEFDIPVDKILDDKDVSVILYSFKEPLKPGQEFNLLYDAEIDRKTFPNNSPDTHIVRNGTFFNDLSYFPQIGYLPNREISATKTRAKYGLKPKKRMAEINDERARNFPYISRNSHWIDFEAIVSTSSNQRAIAPGYLIKEWMEGDRRYFHYKMDQKMLNFYSFLSGKYKLQRDKWKNVNIEIYYHPHHNKNIDKMIESTKMSLDYFSKNFGPYQHRQFRIIEFPRYSSFAQSFPNTIPFSESLGFTAKVEKNNPKDIDYPFYMTAHELAHQWWAHQVIGGGVQGATMMSEAFSDYSALMVMEKKYGLNKVKRILKYKLNQYLQGRSKENERELPLYLNENQDYIHYSKGALIMYALKDYVGEQAVNNVLREYVNKVAFQEPPFTTSIEFLDLLESKVPSKYHPLIDDMFRKIVLFENKPLEAKYKKLRDDLYRVSFKFNGKKYYSDENGKEKESPFQQSMYIGIEDSAGEFLYLKKHKVKNGENEFVIEVEQTPYLAGIDPLNMLVDKNPDDNQIRVSQSTDSLLDPHANQLEKPL